MSPEPDKSDKPDDNAPGHIVRIIGIGNPMRSDDGVGHLVIDLIEEKLNAQKTRNKNINLEKYSDNLIDILYTLEKKQTILIIDAAYSDHEPGKILEFDLTKDRVNVESLSFSSHGLNPLQVFDMAKNLAKNTGDLPEKIYLYVIECKNFKTSEKISPEIQISAKVLAENIYLSQISL